MRSRHCRRNCPALLSGAQDRLVERQMSFTAMCRNPIFGMSIGFKSAQGLPFPAGSSGCMSGRIAHKIFRNEPGRSRRSDKGAPRHADGNNTVHGGFDLLQGRRTRTVCNRPFLQQPVFCLFDRAEFLHIPVRRYDKAKGLPPVDFNQSDIFLER